MRLPIFLAGALVLAAPLALAQDSTWVPDKAHSEVDFSVLHMSLSNVRGRFGNVSGAVVQDPSDITRSKVDMTIDLSTVDSGVSFRDNDLRSANFFDVAQFPTATFVSTKVEKTATGLAIDGNLTLHGVTKPVVLEADGPTGPVQGMDHKQHEGFSATTTISRAAFGIGPKYGDNVVGDQVKLTIDLDLAQQ